MAPSRTSKKELSFQSETDRQRTLRKQKEEKSESQQRKKQEDGDRIIAGENEPVSKSTSNISKNKLVEEGDNVNNTHGLFDDDNDSNEIEDVNSASNKFDDNGRISKKQKKDDTPKALASPPPAASTTDKIQRKKKNTNALEDIQLVSLLPASSVAASSTAAQTLYSRSATTEANFSSTSDNIQDNALSSSSNKSSRIFTSRSPSRPAPTTTARSPLPVPPQESFSSADAERERKKMQQEKIQNDRSAVMKKLETGIGAILRNSKIKQKKDSLLMSSGRSAATSSLQVDWSASFMTSEENQYDFFDRDEFGNLITNESKIPIFPEDFTSNEQRPWPLSWWGIVAPTQELLNVHFPPTKEDEPTPKAVASSSKSNISKASSSVKQQSHVRQQHHESYHNNYSHPPSSYRHPYPPAGLMGPPPGRYPPFYPPDLRGPPQHLMPFGGPPFPGPRRPWQQR